MRIISIDYGDSRVGIAITDELCITAQGLETIEHKGNDKILLKKIAQIIEQYNVEEIVVGIPINLNGTRGERVEKTEAFIHKLKCLFNKTKISKIDERLTTVQAHKTMNLLNVNKYKKKSIVDTLSATYILEVYLEKRKNDMT